MDALSASPTADAQGPTHVKAVSISPDSSAPHVLEAGEAQASRWPGSISVRAEQRGL